LMEWSSVLSAWNDSDERRTRNRCPCANNATSPSAALARTITRSARAPTSSGLRRPGIRLGRSASPAPSHGSAWASDPRMRRSSTRRGRSRRFHFDEALDCVGFFVVIDDRYGRPTRRHALRSAPGCVLGRLQGGGCKGCTTYRPNPVTGAVLEATPAEATPVRSATAQSPADLLVRSEKLTGATYKLRWPDSEHAFYVTINVRGAADRPVRRRRAALLARHTVPSRGRWRRRFGLESGDHCRGLGRLRQGGKVAQIGTRQRSADRLPGATPAIGASAGTARSGRT
jgi:hypothetical protein